MSNQLQQASPDDDILISKAAALHQAGHLGEAEKIYKEILARSPQDFHATHLLGVIALQQGRFELAQRLINAAVVMRPNDVSAVCNLGVSYLRDGQLEVALQWFDIAVKLQPDLPVALTNSAELRYHMGRYDEAISLLKRVRTPDPPYAICRLLGACLMQIGAERNAIEHFEAATRLRPDDAEAWANLSVALRAAGDDGRAIECANRAAELQPESAAALNALARAQFEQGRMSEALASYQRGISLGTPPLDVILSYANALLANGLQREALEQLRRALTLDENNLGVRWALALAQLKTVYETESDVLASRQAFGRALEQIKAWYENTPGIAAPYRAVGSVQPFLLAYQHYNNRDLLQKYGALCVTFMKTLPRRTRLAKHRCRSSTLLAQRKLRLGIISAHIREHSIWTAVTKGWVRQLDRSRFEINIFHLDRTVDRETEEARSGVAHFDNGVKDASGWAESITDAELDVALFPEIGSDPLTAKLASMRLAPVQAVTWGHPETSGLPTMDLYISGRAFEPPGAAEHNYSEKLVLLPSFGVYVEPLGLANSDPDLEALQLPTDRPLLLCPGQPFKYAPRYDHVWVEIAKGLRKRGLFRNGSAGHIVFFRSHYATWDRQFEQRLRSAFVTARVDFDAHVSIVPFLEHARFFGLMRKSALMLDSPGFSGFNTALQGIECDLPVLAFEGDFLRSRLASGILRELDLPDLVATTEADFVQKAVALAKNAERIRELRAKIIERRAKLFGDLTPVRALERCLIEAAGAASPPDAHSRA